MADDLTDKLTVVVCDHFQGASADELQVELMIALASIAAALICADPAMLALGLKTDQELVNQRRAIFDGLVTKALDKSASERLDKMGH
jgi:UDP-N-acetylglucosamine transferase subunit ALG13